MSNRFEEDFNLWIKNSKEEKDLLQELKKIQFDEEEIEDRFYKDLEFGTAGIRGLIGVGKNRMNVFVVGRITQAFCEFLKKEKQSCSVVISYDSREKSLVFARICASVFFANGFKVYIFKEMAPVPVLSFAIRELSCDAGVMITASHNSYKYNGYKLYGSDGGQILESDTKKIYEIFSSLDVFNDVKKISFEEAFKGGGVQYVSDLIIEKYYEKINLYLINKEVLKNKDFSVIYTPLNGSGKNFVFNILKRCCVENFSFVEEQKEQDPSFKTCKTPDPGNKDALFLGIRYCKMKKADILIATDPDGDRVGVAVPLNETKKEYIALNGNEIAVLMFNYICKQRKNSGNFPSRPIAFRTIVSSNLIDIIAKEYGVEIKSVMTGFKHIGEQIKILQKQGREKDFIFAFEESNSYLFGSYVRDKDGVFSAVLLCEMAAFYKEQKKTILEVLEEIYIKYGYCFSCVENFYFTGVKAKQNMNNIMQNLRNSKIEKIGEFVVEKILDYSVKLKYDLKKKTKECLEFSKQNILEYRLKGNISLIVRPSGTEPKIKVYYNVYSKTKEEAFKLKRNLIDVFNIKKYF